MRSRIVVLAACFVLAVAAWAGDPWKEKTYKEWNEKDVDKILSDSPWARVVTVPAFWRGGEGMPAVSGQRAGAATGGGGAGAIEGGGAARGVSGTGEAGGAGTPNALFVVRWGSARIIREALVRLAVLRGTPEAEAEKLLSFPVEEHQLVLMGSDMMPFAKSEEKGLQEKTFLKSKKTKQKITPIRAEIKRATDGKKILAIIFFFAMKSEAGEPFIAADEKGMEFECRTESVTIRTSFDPQKMVGKAGPDFQ